MKAVCRHMFLLFLIALAGCSSISVNHDYDTDADFQSYRTFTWMPAPQQPAGNAQAARNTDPLVGKRVMNAVTAELANKGLLEVSDKPDLLVAYHTGVEDKVDVTDWGYSYGGYYSGWGGRDVTVTNYKQGTLIVDLVDAGTKQLVYRVTATGALSSNPSPEEMQKSINQVVKKMLKSYPPK